MRRIVRRLGNFLAELKRRRVYRVAVAYLVVAIGALELAGMLVPTTTLPAWTESFVVVLAIVGFPIVVMLAWTFDITPGGIRRGHGAASDPGDRTGAPAVDPASESTPAPPSAVSKPVTGSATGRPSSPDAGPTVAPGIARDDESRPGAEPRPRTIAVLPFANLSEAPEAEPLVAGLHDDLLTELSRASALTVISRTSVLRYRGTTKTIRQIGRELGAGAIVEGGMQKAGDRIRLNIQLIDARSDVHLWAERYDRELSAENIFELQSDLAARIMEALNARLTGAEAAQQHVQPTADLEAYRQYSIARALFVERSEEALLGAAEHFERATDRDADYALAWCGLGQALVMLVEYQQYDAAEYLARAEDCIHRALDLDPGLAEGHSALGNLHSAHRRCRKALEAHERALALRPGFAGAHQWRCWVSLLMGDAATALEAGARACRLDPLDPEASGNLAMAQLGSGEPEEAERIARATLERHADFDWARWVLGLALMDLGRHDEASRALRRLSEAWASHWPETVRGLDGVRAGDVDVAREALRRQREAGAPFHAGLLHAALGEAEEALATLGEALPLAWDEALTLRFHRGEPLGALRAHPRWPALIRDLDRAWGV